MLAKKGTGRPRWSLSTLLIAAAIAAAILAVLLRPFLVPFAYNTSTSVLTGIPLPRTVGIDILWEPGTGKEQLRQVIVYPPGVLIDSAQDLRYAPQSKDISVRRTMVFVDGKAWHVKEHPCFLVFDPSSRLFHEVPIRSGTQSLHSAEDVIRLPEWKSEVIPVLALTYGTARKEKILPPDGR